MRRWKRETSWWDDLEVTAEVCAEYSNIFSWVDEVAPEAWEHDYVLYTDGSGCERGWGGYAALIEKYDLVDEERQVVDSWPLMGGTHGSTVARSEMTAFLDGIHSIVRDAAGDLLERSEEMDLYEIKQQGILNRMTGPDRVTVLWYTDRENLAKALLYDENGDPLQGRRTETDLWMRWSTFARSVCVTPLATLRNTVDGQAACDAMAGLARESIKAQTEVLAAISDKLHPTSWTKKRSQKALF